MKAVFKLISSLWVALSFTASLLAQSSFTTVADFPHGVSQVSSGLVRLNDGLLYGVSPTGGKLGGGCIFRVNPSNGAVTILEDDPLAEGVTLSLSDGVGLKGYGTTLYGIVNEGEDTRNSYLWKWDATAGLVKLFSFLENSNYGTNPVPQLAISSTGVVYGVCRVGGTGSGGTFGGGSLWSYSAGQMTELATFDTYHAPTIGFEPQSLYLAEDGAIYGATFFYQEPETEYRCSLWKWTSTHGLVSVAVLPGSMGDFTTSLVATTTGKITGITHDSTSYRPTRSRQLWTWTPSGGFVTRKSFGDTSRAISQLVLHTDGHVYGTNVASSKDEFWRLSSSNVYSVLATYPTNIGSKTSGLIAVDGSTFYMANVSGGTSLHSGTVFQYHLTNGASLITAFSEPPAGVNPGALVRTEDGSLYGMSKTFGDDGSSILWKHNPTSGLVRAGDFENLNLGDHPIGPLLTDLSGAVYGINESGPHPDRGLMWKYSPSTQRITPFASLGSKTVPGAPTGAFAKDNQGNFYGANFLRFARESNVLWKVTANGTLSKLASLSVDVHGTYVAQILVHGTTIYGVSTYGGILRAGALWKWTPTSGLQLIASFGTDDPFSSVPSYPSNGLVMHSDGSFYGLAGQGVWRYHPSSGLTTIAVINEAVLGRVNDYTDAAQVMGAGLVIDASGILYGVTQEGSNTPVGTLWQLDTQATVPSFSVLHTFSPTESGIPDLPAMVLALDGGVYGTAEDVLFRYGPPQIVGSSAPTVSALATTFTSATRLIVSGTVNANHLSTAVSFQFGTTATALTGRLSSAPATVTGSSSTVVTSELTGLTPNTLYFIRAVGQNSYGTTQGPVMSFHTATAPTPPLTVTSAATSVTLTGATLNGTVNARGLSTQVFFDYGLSATALTTTVALASQTSSTATPVSTDLTGLLPHTRYFYRARSLGDHGSSMGATLSFTTLNTFPAGNSDTAVALPSAAIPIRVLFNDSDADGDSLSIFSFTQPPAAKGSVTKVGNNLVFTPTATFTGMADFTYIVADAFGGKSTPTAVQVSTGTCSLYPSAVTMNSLGGSSSIQVTAPAPFSVVESLPWVDVAGLDLTTSPPQITLVLSSNLAVAARNGSVFIGGIALPISQSGVTAPVMNAASLQTITTVGDFYSSSVSVLSGPAVITRVTGTLPPGLILSPAGTLAGRPTSAGTYTFTVRGTNAAGSTAPQSVTILVNGTPAHAVGSYFGTFPPDSLVNDSLGAYFRMTVSAVGGVTGSLTIDGVASPFTAAILDGDGSGGTPAVSIVIPRRGKPALAAYFEFDTTGTVDYVTGQLHLASTPRLAPGTVLAPGIGGKANTVAGTNIAGRFVASLGEDSGHTEYAKVPHGPGYITFVVSPTGSATVGGKLPDGAALTGSFQIISSPAFSSATRPMPLFIPLYGGKGVLSGTPAFHDDPAFPKVSSGSASTPAAMRWMKKPQSGTLVRAYASGFGTNLGDPYELALSGEEWVVPPPGTNAMYLAVAPENAIISLLDAGISETSADSTVDQRPFTVGANSACSFGPVSSNPAAISVTLFPALGTWTASFDVRQNHYSYGPSFLTRITAEGVLRLPLAGATHREARGFFLLPKIYADLEHPVARPDPATNTSILAGSMSLLPWTAPPF